jgi:hypothetical protein
MTSSVLSPFLPHFSFSLNMDRVPKSGIVLESAVPVNIEEGSDTEETYFFFVMDHNEGTKHLIEEDSPETGEERFNRSAIISSNAAVQAPIHYCIIADSLAVDATSNSSPIAPDFVGFGFSPPPVPSLSLSIVVLRTSKLQCRVCPRDFTTRLGVMGHMRAQGRKIFIFNHITFTSHYSVTFLIDINLSVIS